MVGAAPPFGVPGLHDDHPEAEQREADGREREQRSPSTSALIVSTPTRSERRKLPDGLLGGTRLVCSGRCSERGSEASGTACTGSTAAPGTTSDETSALPVISDGHASATPTIVVSDAKPASTRP